jgi:hypothetical protein
MNDVSDASRLRERGNPAKQVSATTGSHVHPIRNRRTTDPIRVPGTRRRSGRPYVTAHVEWLRGRPLRDVRLELPGRQGGK